MNLLNFSWVIDGKLAGHQAPSSEHDLIWLKKQGVRALVRMAEKHKTEVTNVQITQLGLWDCHEPVPDFTAPTKVQIDTLVEFIDSSLKAGRPVGVSCGAGFGRTGTILACYLVKQGYKADAAIDEVRAKRPGSIETKSQEEAVKAYAEAVMVKTNMDSEQWPRTLEEAVEIILSKLSEEDKDRARSMSEFEFVASCHLSLGMYIRNRFGLWQGNQEVKSALGVFQADAASGIILTAVWKRLKKTR